MFYTFCWEFPSFAEKTWRSSKFKAFSSFLMVKKHFKQSKSNDFFSESFLWKLARTRCVLTPRATSSKVEGLRCSKKKRIEKIKCSKYS